MAMGSVHSVSRNAATRQERDVPALSDIALRWVEMYALVLTVAQIMVLEIIGRNTLIPLGGSGLQAADLAMPALPVLAALLILRGVRFTAILLAFLAFYALTFVRGLITDPSAALNAFRFDVTLILLILSFSTGGLERMGYKTVCRILVAASMLVAAVSLSRFAYGPNFLVDMSNVDIEIADDWNDGRTLGAPAVLIMVCAILFGVMRDYATAKPQPRIRWDLVTIFLLGMVLASGQRTACLGFALALGLMAINRFRAAVLPVLILVPFALFVVWTGIIDLSGSVAENIGQNMGGRSGTFAFRMSIWNAFFQSLDQWHGFDLLFGRPLGQRPVFYLLQRLWTASLHSAYVGLIPLIGFAGMLVFLTGILLCTFGAMGRFIKYQRGPMPPGTELQLFSAAVLLVYGISYEWRNILGVLIGILILPSSRPAGIQKSPSFPRENI
jgi:hypothetical protein